MENNRLRSPGLANVVVSCLVTTSRPCCVCKQIVIGVQVEVIENICLTIYVQIVGENSMESIKFGVFEIKWLK